MEVKELTIKDLLVITPKTYEDERGYFMESFNESHFKNILPHINFVQDNESRSSYGVLRGLHFQTPPYQQSKLVRVIKGKVLDIAVDIRKNSPTFGSYESIILSDENKKQFFIPRDFAHGFIVLSDYAIFSYKVDNKYSPNHESGIIYNDKNLGIDWILPEKDIILSEKDKKFKSLKETLI